MRLQLLVPLLVCAAMTATARPQSPSGLDVFLVIDHSGSMGNPDRPKASDADRSGLRWVGAMMAADLLGTGDRCMLVPFNQAVISNSATGLLSAERVEELRLRLRNLTKAASETNFVAPLRRVQESLAPGRSPRILFLTDGFPTVAEDLLPAHINRAIPVYRDVGARFVGIGLGRNADLSSLRALIDGTGGLIRKVTEAEELVGLFTDILLRDRGYWVAKSPPETLAVDANVAEVTILSQRDGVTGWRLRGPSPPEITVGPRLPDHPWVQRSRRECGYTLMRLAYSGAASHSIDVSTERRGVTTLVAIRDRAEIFELVSPRGALEEDEPVRVVVRRKRADADPSVISLRANIGAASSDQPRLKDIVLSWSEPANAWVSEDLFLANSGQTNPVGRWWIDVTARRRGFVRTLPRHSFEVVPARPKAIRVAPRSLTIAPGHQATARVETDSTRPLRLSAAIKSVRRIDGALPPTLEEEIRKALTIAADLEAVTDSRDGQITLRVAPRRPLPAGEYQVQITIDAKTGLIQAPAQVNIIVPVDRRFITVNASPRRMEVPYPGRDDRASFSIGSSDPKLKEFALRKLGSAAFHVEEEAGGPPLESISTGKTYSLVYRPPESGEHSTEIRFVPEGLDEEFRNQPGLSAAGIAGVPPLSRPIVTPAVVSGMWAATVRGTVTLRLPGDASSAPYSIASGDDGNPQGSGTPAVEWGTRASGRLAAGETAIPFTVRLPQRPEGASSSTTAFGIWHTIKWGSGQERELPFRIPISILHASVHPPASTMGVEYPGKEARYTATLEYPVPDQVFEVRIPSGSGLRVLDHAGNPTQELRRGLFTISYAPTQAHGEKQIDVQFVPKGTANVPPAILTCTCSAGRVPVTLEQLVQVAGAPGKPTPGLLEIRIPGDAIGPQYSVQIGDNSPAPVFDKVSGQLSPGVTELTFTIPPGSADQTGQVRTGFQVDIEHAPGIRDSRRVSVVVTQRSLVAEGELAFEGRPGAVRDSRAPVTITVPPGVSITSSAFDLQSATLDVSRFRLEHDSGQRLKLQGSLPIPADGEETLHELHVISKIDPKVGSAAVAVRVRPMRLSIAAAPGSDMSPEAKKGTHTLFAFDVDAGAGAPPSPFTFEVAPPDDAPGQIASLVREHGGRIVGSLVIGPDALKGEARDGGRSLRLEIPPEAQAGNYRGRVRIIPRDPDAASPSAWISVGLFVPGLAFDVVDESIAGLQGGAPIGTGVTWTVESMEFERNSALKGFRPEVTVDPTPRAQPTIRASETIGRYECSWTPGRTGRYRVRVRQPRTDGGRVQEETFVIWVLPRAILRLHPGKGFQGEGVIVAASWMGDDQKRWKPHGDVQLSARLSGTEVIVPLRDDEALEGVRNDGVYAGLFTPSACGDWDLRVEVPWTPSGGRVADAPGTVVVETRFRVAFEVKGSFDERGRCDLGEISRIPWLGSSATRDELVWIRSANEKRTRIRCEARRLMPLDDSGNPLSDDPPSDLPPATMRTDRSAELEEGDEAGFDFAFEAVDRLSPGNWRFEVVVRFEESDGSGGWVPLRDYPAEGRLLAVTFRRRDTWEEVVHWGTWAIIFGVVFSFARWLTRPRFGPQVGIVWQPDPTATPSPDGPNWAKSTSTGAAPKPQKQPVLFGHEGFGKRRKLDGHALTDGPRGIEGLRISLHPWLGFRDIRYRVRVTVMTDDIIIIDPARGGRQYANGQTVDLGRGGDIIIRQQPDGEEGDTETDVSSVDVEAYVGTIAPSGDDTEVQPPLE